MADIEKKISGFRFVDFTGKHVSVDIYKSEDQYLVEINFTRSSRFDSMDKVWDAVKEVEEIRKLCA